jgi:NAD(P)-dependent dehydrogenase (short-subunit alcohol dehydrogenase family)
MKDTFAVDLNRVVAMVPGASRGAGRAIALVLGEAGATVYVTGRIVRGRPSAPGRSGTLEETGEAVAQRGFDAPFWEQPGRSASSEPDTRTRASSSFLRLSTCSTSRAPTSPTDLNGSPAGC